VAAVKEHSRSQDRCAVSAARVQKTVRQDATFEIGLELVFDKLRQARTGLRFDVGEEGLCLGKRTATKSVSRPYVVLCVLTEIGALAAGLERLPGSTRSCHPSRCAASSSVTSGRCAPDPAALEFASRVACVVTLVDGIRAKLNGEDDPC
jgi:hypothetical protein